MLEHFDNGTDTFIGVSKEGKDIVPGRHIMLSGSISGWTYLLRLRKARRGLS